MKRYFNDNVHFFYIYSICTVISFTFSSLKNSVNVGLYVLWLRKMYVCICCAWVRGMSPQYTGALTFTRDVCWHKMSCDCVKCMFVCVVVAQKVCMYVLWLRKMYACMCYSCERCMHICCYYVRCMHVCMCYGCTSI